MVRRKTISTPICIASKKRSGATIASSARELDLFSIEEEAGGGLVFWHPKGAIVRGLVEDFIREGLRERGYLPVVTPHIVRERFYEISGHLENFSENMFGPIEVEEQRFRLKPMNCPGHILIYKNRLRSYRDLPLRFSEFGTVYRFERSGVLHGLTRVRGFTQDDAHLFCTPDQLQGEFEHTLDEALRLMKAFGFNEFQVRALDARPEPRAAKPTRSPRKRFGNALQRYELRYEIDEGGGAFYGPKLDINVRDALGRPWQLGTVQVDFVLPARFGLKYRAADGQDHRPVMIHRALAGSLERFFGMSRSSTMAAHFRYGWRRFRSSSQPISEHQAEYAQEAACDAFAERAFGSKLTKTMKSSDTRYDTGRRKKCPTS